MCLNQTVRTIRPVRVHYCFVNEMFDQGSVRRVHSEHSTPLVPAMEGLVTRACSALGNRCHTWRICSSNTRGRYVRENGLECYGPLPP